jgi:hypothetical protein
MKANASATRPAGAITRLSSSANTSPDEKTPLMVINVDKEQKA